MIVKNKSTAKISNYTYDDLHRLISATITNAKNGQNYVQTYAYDITGNILVKSDLGNYQYNDKNPQAVTRAGNVSYSYDDSGNLLTDGTYTHTWDYKNRLINSQPTAQNPQLKYSYDESGNRVLKENISSGEKTYYVNKFYEVENSQTTSSSKFTKYIYAGDIKVADEIITEDNSLRLTKGKDATTEVKSIKSVFKNIKHKLSGSDESDLTEVIFHHTDHLSGSNVDTDINGNTVEVLDYYPYGNVRLNEKSGDYKNKYKFTGKELDEETNLYYYGARYYNSQIGRFISIDPIQVTKERLVNPQGLNLYAYVNNNPLRYIDPTGKSLIDWLCPPAYSPAPDDQLGNFEDLQQSYENTSQSTNPITIGTEILLDTISDVYSTVTGTSLVTGEELSTTDQIISGAAIAIPLVSGGILKQVVKESSSIIDDIIQETLTKEGKFTSDYKLTSDELLDAGQKFIGDDYKELGENGSGVYRSADGTKQFRIDDSSLNGQHDPYESHGHLENFDDANDAHPSTINHVIIKNE